MRPQCAARRAGCCGGAGSSGCWHRCQLLARLQLDQACHTQFLVQFLVPGRGGCGGTTNLGMPATAEPQGVGEACSLILTTRGLASRGSMFQLVQSHHLTPASGSQAGPAPLPLPVTWGSCPMQAEGRRSIVLQLWLRKS